jgi:myo-inositol 2-dehydrogenase/D-chiro-inositol 1-dehydrogenase
LPNESSDMSDIRVGVVGAGMMGSTHVRTIAAGVRGARVSAVADVDAQRAAAVARTAGDAGVHADGHEVIAADHVDAVLIASAVDSHQDLVLACLDAGKPVLCEKPLAMTAEACRRVVEAEAQSGRGLVQVGFMRRYDAGYAELKRLLDAGEIGAPLLVHCAHRNADAPPGFGTEMAITDSVVHEIDVVRWLLGDEIVAVQVLRSRATRHAPQGVRDPQMLVFETAGGVLVDVESFIRARYGYDIRCEVVGETGTLALAPPAAPRLRRDGRESATVLAGFETRFAQAYRDELQAWVDGVRDGRRVGPTAWDGYAASAVTAACLEALASGERSAVRLEERPPLYA